MISSLDTHAPREQKGRRGPVGRGAPLMTGSSGRTRTYNPSVNSRMLYH